MDEATLAGLEDVKQGLYRSVLGPDGWNEAASMLRALIGADLVAIGMADRRANLSFQLHGDCGADYERLYLDLYLKDRNPFKSSQLSMRPGDILLDEALPDDFERTEFYESWMRPQYQHSAGVQHLVARDGMAAYFMFSRGGAAAKYAARETALLRALNGTLSQVMDLHARLARGHLEQTGHVLDAQGVGWMALDPGGRLVWANEAADELLADAASAVILRNGVVGLGQAGQARQFTLALQAACARDPLQRRGSDMIATHAESGHAVALSIVPADNLFVEGLPALHGAYIGLQDLSRRLAPGFEDRVRAMFDLTPKEAQLAAALAMGRTLADAAAGRGISMPTARSQLVQLFRKTGTSRQGQLVSLLLSVLPVPNLSGGRRR